MGRPGRIELRLPPSPESVAEARSRVLAALAPQVGAGSLETVRLLVSEVVTNAVRHGGSSAPVEVSATWDGRIRIEVTDHGSGFTPAPRTAALDRPGGFGLLLVGRLAERWGVETDDSTRVWFEVPAYG
jgi:anti-sigma regulatory factor (Ser/Thr protein kinase)